MSRLIALLAVLLDAKKWGALDQAGTELLGIHALRYGGQAAAKVAFVLLLAALGLFGIRAGLGVGAGVIGRDAALRSKYLTTLRWLAGQVPRRTPPPPIP